MKTKEFLMKKYIQQIDSDTTLERIEITGEILRIEGHLYTGEKLVIEFALHKATRLGLNWNLPDSIDGMIVNDNSQMLEEMIANLTGPFRTGTLYSFQLISAFQQVVLETIAESVSINEVKFYPHTI